MEPRSHYPMNRTSLVICLAASLVATVGCSIKNYVKQQTTPLINKTNELDDLTPKNTRVGVLTHTVANLDNYHAVAETSVKFGFNNDILTPKAKEALDQLGANIS